MRILDEFTELTDRRKHYGYCKGKMFLSLSEYKKRKLNEVAKIYDSTQQTPRYKSSGISLINDIYHSRKYISYEDYDKYKNKLRINDTFMTRIGSIGKCSVYDTEKDLAYYAFLDLIIPNN